MKKRLKFWLTASLLLPINLWAQGNPFTNVVNNGSIALSSLPVTNNIGTNDLVPISAFLGGTNYTTRNVTQATLRSVLNLGNTNALTFTQQAVIDSAVTNTSTATLSLQNSFINNQPIQPATVMTIPDSSPAAAYYRATFKGGQFPNGDCEGVMFDESNGLAFYLSGGAIFEYTNLFFQGTIVASNTSIVNFGDSRALPGFTFDNKVYISEAVYGSGNTTLSNANLVIFDEPTLSFISRTQLTTTNEGPGALAFDPSTKLMYAPNAGSYSIALSCTNLAVWQIGGNDNTNCTFYTNYPLTLPIYFMQGQVVRDGILYMLGNAFNASYDEFFYGPLFTFNLATHEENFLTSIWPDTNSVLSGNGLYDEKEGIGIVSNYFVTSGKIGQAGTNTDAYATYFPIQDVSQSSFSANAIAANVQKSQDPSLLLWLPLNETNGLTAHDSSGNGTEAFIYDTNTPYYFPPTSASGYVWGNYLNNGGIYLTNSQVLITEENPAYSIINQTWDEKNTNFTSLTFQIWCRNPQYSPLISMQMVLGCAGSFFIGVQSSGTNFYNRLMTSGSTANEQFSLPDNVKDGNWHLFTLTYDGSNLCSYVDGTLGWSTNQSGYFVFSELSINGYSSVDAGSAGFYRDCKLYNRALSQNEILAEYKSKFPVQSSVVTATNAPDGSKLVSTNQLSGVLANPTFGKINSDGGQISSDGSGNLTVQTIAGDGGGLTDLTAGNVAHGTLPDARLSTNIPLLSANTNFFLGNLVSSNGLTSFNKNSTGATLVDDSVSFVWVNTNAFNVVLYIESDVNGGDLINSGVWKDNVQILKEPGEAMVILQPNETCAATNDVTASLSVYESPL